MVSGSTPPVLPLLGDISMGLLVSASDIKAAVLVAEGLFPIATKLLDKIRHSYMTQVQKQKWQQRGQVMIVQSMEQAQRQRKQISDIFMRTKALAILLCCPIIC